MAMGSPSFYPSLFSPSEEEDDDNDTLRWEDIKRLLQANPNVITVELLLSVLKQRPPTGVVAFLLSHLSSTLISSDHFLLPKHGPSPLQVAVKEGCNVDIVRLLIQVCPWALCITNVTAAEDPLSLAKRLGKQDLVTVLQQPLAHWVEEQQSPFPQKSFSSVDKEEEQEDLNNVKLLCARLLKRNQQLSKDVKRLQTTIQEIQSNKYDYKLAATKEKTRSSTVTDQKTTEWEIRLEEEATWNEAVRNDLIEWKQEVQEEFLALQQSLKNSHYLEDGNDENDPPPTVSNNSEYKPKGQLPLSDRPKRRCRPFNSIL